MNTKLKAIAETKADNFIQEFINEDILSGKVDYIKTRFPPEPNGYLHIGHAKALWIDLARQKNTAGHVIFALTIPIPQRKTRNMSTP